MKRRYVSLSARRFYIQVAKVIVPVLIVLLGAFLVANTSMQHSTITGYVIAGCLLATVSISWGEVRLWNIGKHEEAYITTFCLIFFVALIAGRIALYFEHYGGGLYVYSTVFLVLTTFLIFVCSTEHAHHERVIAKQEYGRNNNCRGSRVAHIFFNLITYYVVPMVSWYLLSISLFQTCMFCVFSTMILLAFLVHDEKRRMRKKSLFWK